MGEDETAIEVKVTTDTEEFDRTRREMEQESRRVNREGGDGGGRSAFRGGFVGGVVGGVVSNALSPVMRLLQPVISILALPVIAAIMPLLPLLIENMDTLVALARGSGGAAAGVTEGITRGVQGVTDPEARAGIRADIAAFEEERRQRLGEGPIDFFDTRGIRALFDPAAWQAAGQAAGLGIAGVGALIGEAGSVLADPDHPFQSDATGQAMNSDGGVG